MSYALDRYDSEADARAALPDIFTADGPRDSIAMVVTAYEQLAEHGEPDPDSGESDLIRAAVIADGYWLLHQFGEGADPISLPTGIVAISPIFAGMSAPLTV